MFHAAFESACLRPRGDSKRCATAAFDALLLNGSQLDLQAQGASMLPQTVATRFGIVSISIKPNAGMSQAWSRMGWVTGRGALHRIEIELAHQ